MSTPLGNFMTENTPVMNTNTTPMESLGLSNSSNNINISNINLNDFNTMQMMFKTNGSGLSGNNMFAAEMFGTQNGQKTQQTNKLADDLK